MGARPARSGEGGAVQLPHPSAAGGGTGSGPMPAVSGARPSWAGGKLCGVTAGGGAADRSAGALLSPRGALRRKEALLPFGLQGRLHAASADVLIC